MDNLILHKNRTLAQSQDYEWLRKEGVAYIERLGHKLWSEYNVHDPGVTILELLCYAITDLGFRTAYSMPDILAEETERRPRKAMNFFTAREILPNHPLTEKDLRKLMIDVPGIRNAWVFPADDHEPYLYVDQKESELSYDAEFAITPAVVDKLAKADLPQQITTELAGESYSAPLSRAAVIAKVESIASAAVTDEHMSIILAAACEHHLVKPRGLSAIRLEFEEDPLLGDLNGHYATYTLKSIAQTFGIEVYLPIAGKLSQLRHAAHLPAGPDLHLSALAYDHNDDIYRAGLTVKEGINIVTVFDITIVSHGEVTLVHADLIADKLASEKQALYEAVREKIGKIFGIQKAVIGKLNAHRTLCEDFDSVDHAEIEELGICSDVELTPDADVELVEAQIFHAVEMFLTPHAIFRSLEELLDMGKKVDEIFEGPVLDHGFLIDDELENVALRDTIRASDLINIIMSIAGVTAIKKFQITNYFNGIPLSDGEGWTLKIGTNRAVRFNRFRSKCVYYKGLIPYAAQDAIVEERLKELRGAQRQSRLAADEYDVAVPQGEHRHIQQYTSLQQDFPPLYLVGTVEPPASASDMRKARAKQLQGYVLFFDRLLADYLSQLAHIKDLFSLDPAIKRTRFSRPFFEIPQLFKITDNVLSDLKSAGVPLAVVQKIVELNGKPAADGAHFQADLSAKLDAQDLGRYEAIILSYAKQPGLPAAGMYGLKHLTKDFVTSQGAVKEKQFTSTAYQNAWQTYLENQADLYVAHAYEADPLVESDETYFDRKNRLLDHLVSRFGEQFAEYVLISYALDKKKDREELISDKLAMLNSLPAISSQRGQGFNYLKNHNPVAGINISGLHHRVARLTGIDFDALTSYIEIYQEADEDAIDEYRFRMKDEQGRVLISSSTKYYSREDAWAEIAAVFKNGAKPERYEKKQDARKFWYFNLTDEQGEVIARRIRFTKDKQSCEKEIELAIELIGKLKNIRMMSEGLHVIEHIFIRPDSTENRLLNICLDPAGSTEPGFLDPYSFRITIVVPAWPQRFQNMHFRHYFEDTVRKEAPAHVHVKICWVNEASMARFEDAYYPWLKELQKNNRTTLSYRLAQDKFTEVLESLRSVYPEARLFNCENPEKNNPIVLNNAKIGSARMEAYEKD
ncbi:MAG: DUF1508 domain-containing protein [Chitinivibrionales bacterium]|nr:DUF1508 domain-containing protein [Chitinivibrionales bacterium]